MSPRPLGLARILIGTAALFRAVVAWRVLYRLTDPDVLKTPYAGWLPDPSPTLVISVVVIWVVAAALFTIGWKVAVTGPVLLGMIAITLTLDQQAYSNHLYLMGWLVLLLTLASAGSGINLNREDRPIVAWPVFLIMLQASLVYGFSALTKLNESFLSGSVLAGTLGRGILPFPETLRTPQVLSVVAAMAVFVELFIAIFLWRRSLRPAAFLLGLGLHVSIILLMTDTLELFVFAIEMLAIYPLFLFRERLSVIFDDDCSFCRRWMVRLNRLDLLRAIDLATATRHDSTQPSTSTEWSIRVLHHGKATGFRAITLILEHLVPTLWVAPILRLPGIRQVGEWWYKSRARRSSCPAGGRTNSDMGSISAV